MQKKGQLCLSAAVGSQGLPKQTCPAIVGNIALGCLWHGLWEEIFSVITSMVQKPHS